MSSNILFKEELDYIIKSFKNKKKYSQIAKELNRTTPFIKNEINKYIKEKHHEGTSIYKLSKEFDIPLEKIKEIVDNTKITDISYLEKNKAEEIINLLKSKRKYNEIAKNLDTNKDTVVLYFKRKINEQVKNGTQKDEIKKTFNLSDSQIDKLLNIKHKKINKSEIETLREENKKLKEYIELLKKKVEK